MCMSGEERLSRLKTLLGITTAEQDAVLSLTLRTVEGMILSYINCDELPEGLENALIIMCVSYYKSAGLGTQTAAVGAVTSVKRGDVETSFAVGSSSSGSSNTFDLGGGDDGFFGWRTVLNGYRKLRR